MERRYDVVIAGGGVVGSAIAYFLAAEPAFGGSILVVEKDPTYEFAAASRSTGGIRLQWSTAENVRMCLFGARFFKEVPDRLSVDGHPADIGFREHGYLILADRANIGSLSRAHEVQRANGADTEFLAPDEIRHRFPWLSVDGLEGAYFGPRHEGWYDPHSLVQAYRRKAISLGASYVADEVVGVRRKGARVDGVVLKAGGEVAAGVVVNAAGAHGAPRLAAAVGLALPIEPRKRTVYAVAAKHEVPRRPVVIDPSGLFHRPETASFLVAWAPAESDDPPATDYEVDYSRFESEIWPRLARRVPAFESLKLLRAWSCHYDYNPLDRNAILGAHPELPNFLVATGFSGHGVMQSPATGRAISELIAFGGYRTLDLSRFAYDRFVTGRRVDVWESAVY